METVVKRRSPAKLLTITDNVSPPLHIIRAKERSTFSNTLVQLCCSKKRYLRYFLATAKKSPHTAGEGLTLVNSVSLSSDFKGIKLLLSNCHTTWTIHIFLYIFLIKRDHCKCFLNQHLYVYGSHSIPVSVHPTVLDDRVSVVCTLCLL